MATPSTPTGVIKRSPSTIGLKLGGIIIFVGLFLLGAQYIENNYLTKTVTTTSVTEYVDTSPSTTPVVTVKPDGPTQTMVLDPKEPTEINPAGAHRMSVKHPAGCIYVQRASWTGDLKIYGPYCPTDSKKGLPSNTGPDDVQWAWSKGSSFPIAVTLLP